MKTAMKSIVLVVTSIALFIICGCATFKLVSALQSYGGKWMSVDMAITNSPSGAHLLGLLQDDSPHIRRLISQEGIPNYIRHSDTRENLFRVDFVFMTNNLYISIDRVKGYAQRKELDDVDNYDLPSSLVAGREREKELEQKKRDDAMAKQRRDREAAVEAEKQAEAKRLKEIQDAFDKTAAESRADNMKTETLVLKNLYIGMPISDAAGMLNNHIASSPPRFMVTTKNSKTIVYDRVADEEVALGDDADNVTKLVFKRPIIDALFNSNGMTFEQFMQQFINSYNIPELLPQLRTVNLLGQYGTQTIWSYDSPQGYKLQFLGDALGFNPGGSLVLTKTQSVKALNFN